MYLDDIPPEIQLEILQFSSFNDLPSISRVHSSLRDVAERVLYRHIYFCAHPLRLIRDQESKSWTLKEERSLLHTLSANPWKAAMVRSLHIELTHSSDHGVENAIGPILIKLSQSLEVMPNLQDLRVIYDCAFVNDPSHGRLSETIRDGHFRLHTLWLVDGHDLAGIVANQSNLRFLGTLCDRTNKRFWRKIKGLFQTTMPTICIMKCCHEPMLPIALDISPSSHRPGEVLQECQEIAQSLNDFPRRYIICNEKDGDLLRRPLSILDPTSLEVSIDGITIRPWRLPGFIKAVELFNAVGDITFYFPRPSEDELDPFFADVYQYLIEDLDEAWVKINQIRVRQAHACMLLDREHDWSTTSEPLWDGDDDDWFPGEDILY